MSRPAYSRRGFRRLMQMSKDQVWVFVEGKADRYVYSRLTEAECAPRYIKFRVVIAEELPGGQGGKPGLDAFFIYLRRKGSLVDIFHGKRTVSVFFYDKDVDDFRSKKRRSPHVLYTEGYETENYCFMYGDLPNAAAAAGELDLPTVRAGLDPPEVWRRRAAESWKAWVELCFFAGVEGTGCGVTYGRQSPIHDGPYGPVNPHRRAGFIRALRTAYGGTAGEFNNALLRRTGRVDRLFREGEFDRVFKGKWYSAFLAEDIDRIAAGRRYNTRSLEDKLISQLASSLDLDAEWAMSLRGSLRELIA